jgi:hypothetical protein
MKNENNSEQEAREVEIEIMETEMLDLRGVYREEAMEAYRKLLVASEGHRVYFIQH